MSTQHLSRKEIKHDLREDAFRQGVGKSYEYVVDHRKWLIVGLVGVVALVAAIVGVRAWMGRSAGAANDQLAHAIKVFEAPVVATGAKPEDAQAPSFADEASKRAAAKKLFAEVRSEHGSSGAAAVASVYLGRIALEEGDVKGARQLWQEFLDDHDDHILADAVEVSLIDLDRREGQSEKVVERLRAELDKDDKSLPEDVLLYQLGMTLEQLNRRDEARDSYTRLRDEFPDSPFTQKAAEKLQELGGAPSAAPAA